MTSVHSFEGHRTLHQLEQTVLGCCLRGSESIAEVAALVTPGEFSSHAPQETFRAILALWRNGLSVDGVSLAEHLASTGEIDGVGGYPYIARLLEASPTGANAAQYAAAVHDWYLRREVGRICRSILEEVDSPTGPASELIEDLERQVFALADAGYPGEPMTLESVINDVFDRYDLAHAGKIVGIPSGLRRLDDLTGGFHAGELIVVAARPGVGKTALAVTLLHHACVNHTFTALFVSMEQSHEEIGQRFVCVEGGLNSAWLRLGRLGQVGEEQMVKAGERLRSGAVYVDDRPGQTVLKIAAAARRLKSRGPLDLIVVDYLQLIHAEDPRAKRHEQVAEVSRRLKILARELSVPVVALAQLNRGPEDRPEGKPRLSDLRESGGIEADADLVLLLHRRTIAGDDDPPVYMIGAHLAKQRNGPTDEFDLAYRRSCTRFENASQDAYAEGEIPE